MLSHLTPPPNNRQTITDLLRVELASLRAVVDGLTAMLDDRARPPAGPLLEIAVAVRTATQELGALRD
jgi:hypothetical protein